MNKKIIFITGGARSGKSRFAQEIAETIPGPKAYLATAQALDQEMKERIARHRRFRPKAWRTLEEPVQIAELVQKEGGRFRLILLDCLTLWLSNLLMAGWGERKILAAAGRFLKAARKAPCILILVSNEVGMGIVPENPLARKFRDLGGLIHQKVAREADEVYLLFNGLPLKMKG